MPVALTFSALPGSRHIATSWDTVRGLEPELVIVGPCGFDVDQAAERAAEIEFWCPAVAVDGDAYYSRPAPRLADGVRQLAHLIHPGAVQDPGLPAIRIDQRTGAEALFTNARQPTSSTPRSGPITMIAARGELSGDRRSGFAEGEPVARPPRLWHRY